MSQVNLLIFLSTEFFVVALIKKQKIIYDQKHNLQNDFSEKFFQAVKKIFQLFDLNNSDLETIYFSSGSGNFLSSRILFVFLKSLYTLNPDIQFFNLNKLLWLTAGNKRKLAVLKVTKRCFTWAIFDGHQKIAGSPKCSLQDWEATKKEYKAHQIIENIEKELILKNFFLLRKYFQKTDWKNFQIQKD